MKKSPTTRTVKTTRKKKGGSLHLGMSLDELSRLEEKAVRLEKLAGVLLDTPQQAFYVFSHKEGRFLIGQERLSGLYGFKAGEVEARKGGWTGLLHPDDLPGFLAMRERMLTSVSGEVATVQARVFRKTGGHEWVNIYQRVFERDDDGAVVSEVGMVVVITQLKEAEESLRGTQAACHALFQNNTAGVLSFDEAFRVRDANPMLCRMLKHSRGALLRMEVDDLIAPGNRAAMEKLLLSLKSGGKNPGGFETCLEASDGSRLEVLAAATCMRDKCSGSLQFMLIFTDLTARKQAEAALRREIELNRVLIDHAPVAISLLGADAKFLRINHAAERLVGFKNSEVAGKSPWEMPVLSAFEVKESQKRFQSLLQGAERVEATIPMRTKSGETRLVITETTAVRKGDGRIDYLVTTGTDATERKRLEAEVIRVAEQEHIRIGADLHDGVGQMLTGVAALTEVLIQRLDGVNRSDAERILELIKTAGEEARRLSHVLSSTAVRRQGLAGGLRLIAETIRLNYRRECDCRVDEALKAVGDEADTHLYRIAQEAVNNAIRHGKAGRIRISLQKLNSTTGVLEVSDNGGGMQSAARVKNASNQGIGIRVMEYRANLIGGQIKVHSRPGKGVRVSCHFPVVVLKEGKLTKP